MVLIFIGTEQISGRLDLNYYNQAEADVMAWYRHAILTKVGKCHYSIIMHIS